MWYEPINDYATDKGQFEHFYWFERKIRIEFGNKVFSMIKNKIAQIVSCRIHASFPVLLIWKMIFQSFERYTDRKFFTYTLYLVRNKCCCSPDASVIHGNLFQAKKNSNYTYIIANIYV